MQRWGLKYLAMALFLSASLLTACGGGGGGTPATVDTTAPTTTFSPAGGTYSSSQTVAITANETATIYYTTDGTTPTTASTVYSGSISITANTTLKCLAVDSAGNSGSVKTETYVISADTPTGLAASAGNTLNTISWSAVSGATSYNLYWSTTAGVTTSTGTKITGVTSPYSHTGLTNGTTYYYIVTAVNAGGEGSAGAEVSATPSAITAMKVPDTGQTTKYSTAFGDDSDYTINPPSYTDNGDGTITDNVTGLMWQKCSNGQTGADCSGGSAGTYNWYEASGTADATYNPGGATNVCGSLTTGGHTDWRLPNEFELMGIVDYEILNPAINSTYFPATFSSGAWSATTFAVNTSYAWSVDFGNGSVYGSNKSVNYYVRCVRLGQ